MPENIKGMITSLQGEANIAGGEQKRINGISEVFKGGYSRLLRVLPVGWPATGRERRGKRLVFAFSFVIIIFI